MFAQKKWGKNKTKVAKSDFIWVNIIQNYETNLTSNSVANTPIYVQLPILAKSTESESELLVKLAKKFKIVQKITNLNYLWSKQLISKCSKKTHGE